MTYLIAERMQLAALQANNGHSVRDRYGLGKLTSNGPSSKLMRIPDGMQIAYASLDPLVGKIPTLGSFFSKYLDPEHDNIDCEQMEVMIGEDIAKEIMNACGDPLIDFYETDLDQFAGIESAAEVREELTKRNRDLMKPEVHYGNPTAMVCQARD